jgi:hypothetical protein
MSNLNQGAHVKIALPVTFADAAGEEPSVVIFSETLSRS